REALGRVHVRALVQLVVDAPRSAQPTTGAEWDVRIELDGGERAVALRADGDVLNRRGTIARVGLLAFAIEHATHGTPKLFRERDRRVGRVRRAILRAEAAAHV